MSDLTIGLLSALLATNQPQAVSNLIQQNTGVSVQMVNPSDPAEKELLQLMAGDDAAIAEVDKWIQDNNAFAAQGAGASDAELNAKILARFAPIKKNYEDFLKRYSDFARGHLAYASFLNDIGDEDAAALQNETAAQLDPKNPAAWNNLANFYGEHGPTTNAFVDYAKAIELNPNEPVYYQNLATTVYLFRKDAKEFYGINEQQVFDKALALYRQAMKLAPDNFPLAIDYAQSYYGIRPLRTNDALVAWTNALNIAHDDVEREGVYIHLARIKLGAGRFAEAREQLESVTNSMYDNLKNRLERNLAERENTATNPAAAMPTNEPPEILTDTAAKKTDSISTSTNVIPVSTNEVAMTNTNPLPEISTNILITPTNAIVPTNVLPIITNEIPTLTNPPVFSPKITSALTNVPPNPPKPLQLQMPPPVLRPMPEAPSTNAP